MRNRVVHVMRLGLMGLGLLLILTALPARAQYKISKIVVTNIGPATVSDTFVRANIRTKEGDVYNRNILNEDVRNLHSTGFFSNIQVAEEPAPDGITLYFRLQGKLTLTDISFTGNKKYSKRKLSKMLTSKVGEPLNEQRLFTDRQEIIKKYQKAGYPGTEVTYRIQPDESLGQGTVVFEIKESAKVKITDVYFEGNNTYKDKKLRKEIKTRRRWMFSWLTGSGYLKKDQLEDDKDRLAEFYQKEGYIDYDLKDIQYNYTTSNKLTLTFVVHEGQQYKVGEIRFKGFKLFNTNQVQKALRMVVGETFTLQSLNDDVEAVRDLYGSKGHIDARVVARRRPNTQTGTMDLAYEVDEGDRSYIEKIEISGNIKTKDKVVRRELAVAPGEIFDMTKVKLSQQRLEGLNFFSRVDASPEQTDVPDRRNLTVSLEEKSTGNFNIGAGFSSIDSLIGFVEVTQSNFDLFNPPWFMGGGQKIRLRAQLGTERQDYLLTFIEPWFLGRKLEFTTDLYHRELNYVSAEDYYDQTITGGRLGLKKALGSDFLVGGINYTLEQVEVDVDNDASQVLLDEDGTDLNSKIGLSLSYDTRNHSLQPTKGFRVEWTGELAGGPLGGDSDFYGTELRGSQYFPGIFKGHIIELIGRTGYVDRYDNSDKVPIYERSFLGGINSLRGYEYRKVGPVDENGEPLGGNYFWFGSAEYSLPIIDRLRFALFYDIGMSYSNEQIYNREKYNDNFGFGIRLNLPIGPLRLDYGIPINDSDHNNSSGKFQFSAGYTRDL